jgi:hypothetical protein
MKNANRIYLVGRPPHRPAASTESLHPAEALRERLEPANALPRVNTDPRSALEIQYPRIAEQLVVKWNQYDCEQFLNGLVMDERGDRQGFPVNVIDDLLMLHGTLTRLPEWDRPVKLAARDSEFAYRDSKKEPPPRRPIPPKPAKIGWWAQWIG